MTPFRTPVDHLGAELQPLRLLLQRQALRLRAAGLLTDDAFRGLYIADAQVDVLLRRSDGESLLPFDWDQESADSVLLADRIAALRADTEISVEASLRAGIDLPLVRLRARAGLSRAEIDALLICLAPEIDLGYETLYAYVQNDVTRKHPTVDLVLSLLSPTWEGRLACRRLFAADGALIRRHLVRFVDDPQEREPSALARLLKVDDRVVRYLLGDDALDAALLPFTTIQEPDPAPGDDLLPAEIRDRLLRAAHSWPPGDITFVLTGTDEGTRRRTAGLICAEYGLRLLSCDVTRLLDTGTDITAIVPALCREAVLQAAGIALTGLEPTGPESGEHQQRVRSLLRALAGLHLPIFLPEHPPDDTLPPVVQIDLPRPDAARRRQLWRDALDLDGAASPVDRVADAFRLSGAQIERAARSAERYALLAGRAEMTAEDLQRAAREQSHSGLQRLAQKIEPVYRWEDIVLPPRARQQLQEVHASIVHRHAVYTGWGFGRKLSQGKGVNALFHGPSGAGKTMAAQVLARELGLDLYRIDLSMVVSKYIGETEKNLSTIFREARTSNAILFFDEADALFGKRSEVKDAHDRYANIEVAYLLQQIEEYDGPVILATNLHRNLDDAFARRMHHTVEFPFPDATYRERIWRSVFPSEAPLAEDLDLGFLARQFELSGGNIRNVALAAAFLAAEEGSSITMAHLIQGTARELQKLGRLPSRSDFGQYYETIRGRG